MKYLFTITAVFIVIAFAGCESSDIVSLPHTESRLVVNSISYADHPWRARIAASQDVLDRKMFDTFDNATVKIYENGVFAETLVYADYQQSPDSINGSLYFGTTSLPKAGNVYKITVEQPGYPMIESEFRQPDAIQPHIVSIDTLGPDPEWNNMIMLTIKIGFDDPAGENFYEIIGEASDSMRYSRSGTWFQFVDPVYQENNTLFYQTIAWDDTYFDNTSVILEFTARVFISEQPVYSYSIYLRNLSKEYYQYLKTTNVQRNSEDDPFAQPVLISNNIVNGYGVFGGFTEASETLIVDDDH